MSRPPLVAAALLALAGCGAGLSEVERAERQVAFLEKNDASLGEICEAKRAVQKAAADERDADAFTTAKLFADIQCESARSNGWSMSRSQYDREVERGRDIAERLEKAGPGVDDKMNELERLERSGW